jgi:uncharacterized membrane protein
MRNCALTGRQLLIFYLTLVTVSLVLSVAVTLIGAHFVLAFTGLDMVAVGLALWVYNRRSRDHERVVLNDEGLSIETSEMGRKSVLRMNRHWVRVTLEEGHRCAVYLQSHGRRVKVARFVGDLQRQTFAKELEHALASWT